MEHKDAEKLKNMWDSIARIMKREDINGKYQLSHYFGMCELI